MRIESYHVSTIDSTNSLARRRAALWDRDALTVVTTDEQTGGRGQYNRPWVMVKDKDIAVSYVLYSQSDFFADIPFAVATIVDNTLNLPNTQFKWPNDVIVNHKKICGILVETTPIEDTTCLIIGVGINVLSSSEDWNGIGQPVTSMYLEKPDSPVSPREIINRLTNKIAVEIPKVLKMGYSFAKNQYHKKVNGS